MGQTTVAQTIPEAAKSLRQMAELTAVHGKWDNFEEIAYSMLKQAADAGEHLKAQSPVTTIDTAGFVRALLNKYAAEHFTSVEAANLDEMLVKFGLAEWREITLAEAQEPWADFRGWTEGRNSFCLTDAAKALLD